jgi:hypothetical protein
MATAIGAVRPALAQSLDTRVIDCGASLSTPIVSGTLKGLAKVPTKDSLGILGIGAAAALGAHAADTRIANAVGNDDELRSALKPGATLGGMPFETGAAVAMMSLGRAVHRPCLGSLGSELLQAQLVGAAWTIAIKETTRRARPEGTGFSFPSGHTATAFASATVLQRRFGWKAGIPAYAVATYVAASRVEGQRHYLSDVAFGAALGIVAGRTVNIGHGHQLAIGPLATPRGGGIGFSLIPEK